MSKDKNKTPKDTMSRKYHICLNNALEKGYTQERVIEILQGFKSLRYACGGLEQGSNNVVHWHIYLLCKNGIRHSTLRRAFSNQAHIEVAKGTSIQNKSYILKENKHKEKFSTRIPDTFFEINDCPTDSEEKGQGYRADLNLLYAMIKEKSSISSILDTNSSFLRYINQIEKVRSSLDKETAHKTIRDLDVVYIFGGKANDRLIYIFDKYGIDNVFRCTNYIKNTFDGYGAEPIICFDNFKDSLPLQDMLSLYLSPMPLQLPIRYNNRAAAYTTAVISSRNAPEDLYLDSNGDERQELFDILGTVIQMHADGSVSTYTGTEYFDPERLTKDTDSPFQ